MCGLQPCIVCGRDWIPPSGAEGLPCEACSIDHIAEEGRGLVSEMFDNMEAANMEVENEGNQTIKEIIP